MIFKNKLVWLSPIIAFAVIFIFSLTLFPSVQPQPKNLPIAIVNEDQGVKVPDQPKVNMGKTMVEMIQKTSETPTNEDPVVKWMNVESIEEVQRGLDQQKYYAAFIIPKDFSAKQASLKTPAPTSPEVEIWINQGMNSMASTMAGQILNGVADNINNTVRAQLLEGFKAEGATLTVEQVSLMTTPITKTVKNVNEVGENSANGNAPVSLFQPLWMASMVSAAFIYMAVSKMPVVARKENLVKKLGQLLMGAFVAFVIGFGFTWIAAGMVGLNIPDFMDTALFLTLTSFSFFLMITAVLSMLGMKGISLFALLLFFGAPLLAIAPEMMSSFYRDWIYSWLPMRFMVEGLRELFFFGKGLSWDIVSVLTWIGIISSLIIIASGLKRNVEKEKISEA